MAMVGAVSGSLYRRTHSLSRLAWSWVGGRLAPSTFIKWTGWTLAMALPWWQRHKHCRGYYYYYCQRLSDYLTLPSMLVYYVSPCGWYYRLVPLLRCSLFWQEYYTESALVFFSNSALSVVKWRFIFMYFSQISLRLWVHQCWIHRHSTIIRSRTKLGECQYKR